MVLGLEGKWNNAPICPPMHKGFISSGCVYLGESFKKSWTPCPNMGPASRMSINNCKKIYKVTKRRAMGPKMWTEATHFQPSLTAKPSISLSLCRIYLQVI